MRTVGTSTYHLWNQAPQPSHPIQSSGSPLLFLQSLHKTTGLPGLDVVFEAFFFLFGGLSVKIST